MTILSSKKSSIIMEKLGANRSFIINKIYVCSSHSIFNFFNWYDWWCIDSNRSNLVLHARNGTNSISQHITKKPSRLPKFLTVLSQTYFIRTASSENSIQRTVYCVTLSQSLTVSGVSFLHNPSGIPHPPCHSVDCDPSTNFGIPGQCRKPHC